jgi:hypothetical protein
MKQMQPLSNERLRGSERALVIDLFCTTQLQQL